MAPTVFQGVATALITPLHRDGTLHTEQLQHLIEFQLASSIAALVVAYDECEASTFSFSFFGQLIGRASLFLRHRIPLIAAVRKKDSAAAIKWCLEAEKRGADAILLASACFSSSTKAGILQQLKEITGRTKLPVIIENHAGVFPSFDALQRVAKENKIAGIAEKAERFDQLAQIAARCSQLALYANADDQLLPVLSLGGKGIISTLANFIPDEINYICQLFFEGENKRAIQAQLRLIRLIHALSPEENPLIIKQTTARIGLPAGEVPPLEEDKQLLLEKELKIAGIPFLPK